MPLLSKGRTLVSNVTGQCYRVTSELAAKGGFGEVYRGVELDERRDLVRQVAIKVGLDQTSWHGEAYFGRLLDGQSRVVLPNDAFPISDGSGLARQAKYILIFDWMNDGTIDDALVRGTRWPEKTVVREIKGLLSVLALMHRRGICHGDITPKNVFIDGKRLLLGDLGIAKQALEDKPILLEGRAPAFFVPSDASPWRWTPADDVYQVGLIALCLLTGELVTSWAACGRLLRSMQATDAMKGWIHGALEDRNDRFQDAAEARDSLGKGRVKPARAPRSLRGQVVVFTGSLPENRSSMVARVKRAGATVQTKVNGQTTLVVAGNPNLQMIGTKMGKKLFNAERRIRRGQRIAIVAEKRFRLLLDRS